MRQYLKRVAEILFLTVITAVLLGACSGASNSNYRPTQPFYDQYMDRAGHYDFAEPVIMIPRD